MKPLLFSLGMIWILTSICSLLIGPLVGIDKSKLKKDISLSWRASAFVNLQHALKKLLFIIGFFGFLAPAVYPFYGLAVGFVFFSAMRFF